MPLAVDTWIFNLSNAVVVVVSAVSMCSQKVKVVFVQPAGIVTVWDEGVGVGGAVAVEPGVPGAAVGGLAGAVGVDDARRRGPRCGRARFEARVAQQLGGGAAAAPRC